ncbi:hypothetical protein BU26DRAFT_561508 [Trematosphaeria pertusa]|uniref:F-box domain-containing protein n=1 Tax=Trematosphaeria pertusa TaxID=390896 RepID=A0A6A6IN80_9PLEO|nr:uncharacterized protein BU26DRAFT_561508 [Trematosphaeria pertusa]KAF2251697.1 hypothetical protein BU26DRAFT_561508 [Trematosphaeria pertusa]
MTSLLSLPDELFLEIWKYVDGRALYALCLTCRTLRPSAQETLYTAPALWEHYCISYIGALDIFMRFTRTLLDRPDLAHHVRFLRVVIGSDYYKISPHEFHLDAAHKIIEGLPTGGKRNGRAAFWMQLIHEGNWPAWGGLLLSLVPRLLELELELISHRGLTHELSIHDNNRYLRHGASSLLGSLDTVYWPDENNKPLSVLLDLPSIAGLRSLTKLKFLGVYLNADWLKLPNLASLEIGRDCHCPDLTGMRLNSPTTYTQPRISSLQLDVPTSLLLPYLRSSWPLRSLDPTFITSENFGNVRQLSICFTNTGWVDPYYSAPRDFLHQRSQGDMSVFLDRLQSISGTLETLRIWHYSDTDTYFFQFIKPLISLAGFTKLKTLTIPQEFLLGPDYGKPDASWHPLEPPALLPNSLETLTILFPTLHILGWLEKGARLEQLGGLKNVVIQCNSQQGDVYSTFRFGDNGFGELVEYLYYCGLSLRLGYEP